MSYWLDSQTGCPGALGGDSVSTAAGHRQPPPTPGTVDTSTQALLRGAAGVRPLPRSPAHRRIRGDLDAR